MFFGNKFIVIFIYIKDISRIKIIGVLQLYASHNSNVQENIRSSAKNQGSMCKGSEDIRRELLA